MGIETGKNLSDILMGKARPYHPATEYRGWNLLGIKIAIPVPILDITEEPPVDQKDIRKTTIRLICEGKLPMVGIEIFTDKITFPSEETREVLIDTLVTEDVGSFPIPDEFSSFRIKK